MSNSLKLLWNCGSIFKEKCRIRYDQLNIVVIGHYKNVIKNLLTTIIIHGGTPKTFGAKCKHSRRCKRMNSTLNLI